MVGDFDAFWSIIAHLHNDLDLALFIYNESGTWKITLAVTRHTPLVLMPL